MPRCEAPTSGVLRNAFPAADPCRAGGDRPGHGRCPDDQHFSRGRQALASRRDRPFVSCRGRRPEAHRCALVLRSGGGCGGHLRQRGRERNHHALPVPQHIRRPPRVVRSRPRRDPGPPGVVRRGHAGRHPRLHAARPGSCLRADGELPHGRPVSGDDAGRAARPGLLRQGAPPRPARIPRRWRRWSARSWTA